MQEAAFTITNCGYIWKGRIEIKYNLIQSQILLLTLKMLDRVKNYMCLLCCIFQYFIMKPHEHAAELKKMFHWTPWNLPPRFYPLHFTVLAQLSYLHLSIHPLIHTSFHPFKECCRHHNNFLKYFSMHFYIKFT